MNTEQSQKSSATEMKMKALCTYSGCDETVFSYVTALFSEVQSHGPCVSSAGDLAAADNY